MTLHMVAPLVALAILAVQASPSRAQERERLSDPETGDIIVTAGHAITATKTDTPLLETPQSISVIARDQLDRQVITDSLTDILSYSPGILASPYGFDPRVDRFAIRGFDASASGLYRDSIQLPSFGDSDRSFRVEPYGLERIEILRGPSSVLYGNGSLGGLVNAISKRPTPEALAEVELEAGSYERLAGKFDFSGPVGESCQFLYRLTGLARSSDTQLDFARNDRLYVAPAITWVPDSNTSVTVLTHYQKTITAVGTQGFPALGTLYSNRNGRIPIGRSVGEPDFDQQRSVEYSFGYELEHRFRSNLSFRQNLRYDHLEVNAKSLFGNGFDPADPDQRTLLRISFTGVEKAEVFSIDNQLQANFETGPIKHVLLVGLEYKHIHLDDAQGTGSAPPIDLFNPVYGAAIEQPPLFFDGNTKESQTGIYAQERMKLFDHLVISLGGREDFVTKTRSDHVTATRQAGRDTAFSGSAGFLYLFDNGITPYLSYSESFLPLFGASASGKAFDPETGRQFEGGVKFQPRGIHSFFTVSAFDLKRQNVLTTDPSNPNASVQTGEQQSRGMEFEAVSSLFGSHLNLSATYTYQHVRTTKSNAGDAGKQPSITPEQITSFYADYHIPAIYSGDLGFGAGVRYQGSTFGDQGDSFRVPGFAVFDAAVHYDRNKIRIAIAAKNILNKIYVASCYSISGCNYGQARAVVGTARYRF